MCYGENQSNFDHDFWSLEAEEIMTKEEIAAAEYEQYLAQKNAD